jgi:putative spermidine/putrescine transport system substrate-binding protein
MLFYRHHKLSLAVTALLMLSLLITACSPAATPTAAPAAPPTSAPQPTAPPTEAPAAPPTEAPQPTAVPQPTEAPAPQPGEPLQSIGEGEGQVDIIAWAGYIERGETDPGYDWVTQFEKDTGCKVNVKTAATSDEMVALMNEGGFDLVTASGDASNRLITGGKVQPINIDLIPSWNTVDERLQSAPWNTVDGVHYGVPYQWGPNVLMYNTEVFNEAPASWNVVFEEQTLGDGNSNKGRVQAYDGAIHIADAAVYLKTHKPELGITDPYELTRDQFNAALDLLRQQRQLVGRYWHDAFVQMDDFTNEGVVASGSWPFQVNFLKSQGVPVDSVFPEEGVTGWSDTTMMHIEAPHPNCAYMWLEWSLNPKLQGDLAAWFGSVPAVPAACKGNELLTDEGCSVNGFDNFDKIYFWKTPSGTCPDGKQECVPYYEWTTNYIAVIGGR